MAGVFSVSVAIFQVFLVVETAGNLRGCPLATCPSMDTVCLATLGNTTTSRTSKIRQKWLMIFNSTKFSCDAAILNGSIVMSNNTAASSDWELHVWRSFSNDTYLLVQWEEPLISSCSNCRKVPFLLSEPLMVKKGDILGIYSKGAESSPLYSSNEFIHVNDTRASLIYINDAVQLYNLSRGALSLHDLGSAIPQSVAYPLLEVAISYDVMEATNSSSPTPSTAGTTSPSTGASLSTPEDPTNMEELIQIVVVVAVVMAMLILLTIVLFIVTVTIYRRRHKPGKVSKGKVTDVTEQQCREASHPLPTNKTDQEDSAGGGDMVDIPAQLTSFKTNDQEYVPSSEGTGTGTFSLAPLTNNTLSSSDYEHDYSAVGPMLREGVGYEMRHNEYDAPNTYYDIPITEYDAPEITEYEDIYEHPPSNEKELYSTLARKNYESIPRSFLEIVQEIGSGEFGTVFKGYWNQRSYRKKVAIKALNLQAQEKDRIKFLQEAVIMGQFRHPNIVKLFGVVKEGEPKMIVLELMEKADLRSVLIELKPIHGQACSTDLPLLLLKFSRQISDGMDYLSKKCFIHRDLAARNILVTEDYICKIGDFGMARDLAYDNCYISSGGLVPVKWTAPEALNFGKYSAASDVWSFGVLLYEIWGLGRKPFEEIENSETIKLVQTGYRLPPPPGCPRMIYTLMINAWHPKSHLRPDFCDVAASLKQPLSEILAWKEEDKIHPEATQLGARIVAGHQLYSDLQFKYYSPQLTLAKTWGSADVAHVK